MSRNILRTASFVALLLLAGLSLLAYRSVHGLQAEAVLSGSMGHAVPAGSLVIVRALPPDHYREGDVVTFRAPTPGSPLVTHRIARLYRLSGGLPVIETKGDTNGTKDPWVLSVGDIVGRKEMALPGLGRFFAWLQTPLGFLGCAFASLVVIVLPEVLSIRPVRPLHPTS